MTDFKFTPEDFMGEMCDHCYCDATKIANAKLKEWLDKASTVYRKDDDSYTDGFIWGSDVESYLNLDAVDAKAKLVCVEEIK
jgi:hypothetical protein